MVSHTNLKILHLTTHLNIGGISRYIEMTGAAMARQGHSVLVLSSGGELERDLEKKGIRVLRLPIRTKSELDPKLVPAYFQLVSLIKRENFDVLHAHTRVTQVLAHFASKATGVPVVTTAHGFFKPRLGRRWFGAWGRRVIAISPLVAESLEREHGVDPKNIRPIPNAIDIAESQAKLAAKDAAALKVEYGIPPGAVVLSSISRLVEDKGHAYLVEAVKILQERSKAPFLIILGDGREGAKLRVLVDKYKLKDSVRIIGSERDVTKILAVTDIFVHPATYREGFGLAIAEAMVAGKPVIATDIPAINTLIVNGQNGLIVPPKNADAIADAVLRLAQDPAQAKTLGDAGRQKALELCSLERMVQAIESVYREVLRVQ